LPLNRASELFFEISRRRDKAPWMARERCVHGRTFSATRWRMISKNAEGTRRAKRLRKRLLPTFWSFQKWVVVPGTGIEKRHGCQARCQAKRISQSNKKEEQTTKTNKKPSTQLTGQRRFLIQKPPYSRYINL